MHICDYQQKKDTRPVLRRGMPSAFHAKIEEGKIGKGESEEEIALWDEEIEDNFERADKRRIHDAIKARPQRSVKSVVKKRLVPLSKPIRTSTIRIP